MDGSLLEALADPLLGRVLQERYVIEAVLGEGGMGCVYRGRHEVLGRRVAIKVLAPRLARDPLQKERFLREARAANRIDHENIIDIHDVGETSDGMAFLVMELLSGSSLEDLLERGPLGIARACHIGQQLARALGRAHALGVVHRDVKPGNVFLVERHGDPDFVKLLDFGLARAHGDTALTGANTIFGTPEYMAPERFTSSTSAPSSDLYALGCLLFELFTGRVPFEGSPATLIVKHNYEPPPRPSLLRADLPPALEGLVLGLLAKDPAARGASAFAVADQLAPYAPSVRPPSGPSAAAPGSESPASAAPAMRHEEDRWYGQAQTLVQRVFAVQPGGGRRATMVEALDRLGALVSEVRELRSGLHAIAKLTAERHDSVRATRLRIGSALDTLAADHAREAARHEALRATLEVTGAQLDGEARRMLVACDPLLAVPSTPAPAVLERLRVCAQDWSALQRELFRLRAEAEQCRATCADLGFQIEHLKGRLASLEAGSQADLEPQRDQATRLEAEIAAKLYALRLEAERLSAELTAA